MSESQPQEVQEGNGESQDVNSNSSLIDSTPPDFVLVWDDGESSATSQRAVQRRSVFEYNLEEEGLLLQWENLEDAPSLHALLIWAPLEVLKRYSEILKFRLPIKQLPETELLPVPRKSDTMEMFWKCCENFRCMKLNTGIFPEKLRQLTSVYSRDREYLFEFNESNMHELIPESARARIVQYILKKTPYKMGQELELDVFAVGYERLIQQGFYECAYPLHDGTINSIGCTRNKLHEHWGRVSKCLKHQPLDTIKEYFGVNIALYFAWLGFYTRMLIFAAIFGTFCFIYGVASFSSDEFVKDVCNQSSEITMCPLCNNKCDYWKISDKCSYAKVAHLFDNDLTVLFAFVMSIWTAVFLEYWKRYAATITYYWDLSKFDLRDFNTRPEYISELKKMFPTGSASDKDDKAKYDDELSLPFWKKILPFTLISYSTVLFLVVLAIAAVLGVIVFRLWFIVFLSQLSEDRAFHWTEMTVSISAAFVNLTFIVLFGKMYKRIAEKLTEMEFPRTQLDFEASYTLKVYFLGFINNYSSIFYVAFFKGNFIGGPNKYRKVFGQFRQEECGISCMPELCIQLAVIMIGKQAKGLLMEAIVPGIQRVLRRATQKIKVAVMDLPIRKKSSQLVQWHEDYDLLEWGNFSLIEEYLDMVLQFGFVTIFVSAFPLAPLFALINNIFELRLDASKMLQHYRRPVGIRVKDIGVWSDVIDGVVKVAVVSNACIIAMTSNFIPKIMYRYFLDNPNHGSLRGYLKHTLTKYQVNDLESKPDASVVQSGGTNSCYFPAYLYDYTDPRKYMETEDHWKIWLARVVFVVLYENFVGVILLLVRWIIPDVPASLRSKMQKEAKLINELIVQQELLRAQRNTSAHHRVQPILDPNPEQTNSNNNDNSHEKV